MTVAFVNAGAITASASTTGGIPLPMPGSIAPGNLLLAVVQTWSNTAPLWSAGWTQLDITGPFNRGAVAYRIATGSDPQPTVTIGGTYHAGQVFQYSGSSGVGAVSQGSGTSTARSAAGFTTTSNNSASVYLTAVVTVNASMDTPSGWADNTSDSSTDGSVDSGIKILGASGSASGTLNATGAAGPWSLFQIELLASIDPAIGSSDCVLPSIKASGNGYSGNESVAFLPTITAIGTAIRIESLSVDSAVSCDFSPSTNVAYFLTGGNSVLVSDSVGAGFIFSLSVSETISAISAGSSPTIFFETISESATATTGSSAYALFVLVVNSLASVTGAGAASAIYALSAESVAQLMDGTQFVIDFTDGWAYNLNTGAASVYEGMKFNSFALIHGEYYGCNDAGIFKLTGDDDAGEDIRATVTLGTSRLDSDAIKTVPFAYMGAKSDIPMLLTCRVEGQEYSYEFSRETDFMAPAKVKPGKGLEGTYWQIEISNQNGANLDLDHLELITAPKSRKV